MKNLIITFLLILISLNATAFDDKKSLTVEVSTPGTLYEQYSGIYVSPTIREIEVVGTINKSDLVFWNDVSRIAYYGWIEELNLEKAPIEDGIIPNEILGTYNEGRMFFKDSIDSKLKKNSIA